MNCLRLTFLGAMSLIHVSSLFAMHQENFMYLDPQTVLRTKLQIPETIVGERAPTLNGTGYIFYTPTPVAEEYIREEAKPENTLLEIGAGFGNIPLFALEKGVGRYVASDMSEEHLTMLVARLQEKFGDKSDQHLKKLELLKAKAPQGLPPDKEKYDAIMMDKVLHFMNPKEIEEMIGWIQSALKKKGKVYIVTVSPYIPSFRERMLPLYLQNMKEGKTYPGYVENTSELMDKVQIQEKHPHYKIPQGMTFFGLPDLVDVFTSNGFKIKKTFSLKLPQGENKFWEEIPEDQSEVVGFVAEY